LIVRRNIEGSCTQGEWSRNQTCKSGQSAAASDLTQIKGTRVNKPNRGDRLGKPGVH
jgi:hypothetical protein